MYCLIMLIAVKQAVTPPILPTLAFTPHRGYIKNEHPIVIINPIKVFTQASMKLFFFDCGIVLR